MIPQTWRLHRAALAGATLAGAAGGLVLASARPAAANPWVPAAGHGVTKPQIRLFRGDRAYPPGGFTTKTIHASTESYTQFRLTGVQGIGHGLSIEYDLRAGHVDRSATHHGVTTDSISTGLQDQEIGLNYGLVQTHRFADSVELNVVLPTGTTKPAPSLGTGRWALEPDFQAGIARRWGSVGIILGPRIFLDGNATQIRTTIDAEFRATHRLSLTGEIFFVRTIRQASALPPGARGEIYNLLRLGAGAQYRLTERFRPFLLDEVTVAGSGVHAGNRFEFGLAIHY